MNRRIWMRSSAIGVTGLGLTFLGLSCADGIRQENITFLEKLLAANDDLIAELLGRQIKEGDSSDHGGFLNLHKIPLQGPVGWAVHRFGAGYVLEDSAYHKSSEVLEALNASIDFLLRKQHADGTIDLLTTNFHSTPDVAFVVEPVALVYKVMVNRADGLLLPILEKIKTFLLNCGKALSVGGIHTPNHRWVVCMALSRLYELFPNPIYVTRIETWLNEKIDINPDGQFTEQSTGVYSPLCDRWLITIARILNKPELYEPVRQNLELTLYHEHPNGEIATEASRRQDQYQARHFTSYYYPYLYMAHLDQNPTFGAMAHKIVENTPLRSLAANLLYLIEDETLQATPPIGEIPTNYVKHFPHLEMVRIRRGEMDASILAKNSAFVTFHKGDAVLQAVRLASAFFGKGQFIAEELVVEDGRFMLCQTWEGPYYQPYPVDELPETGAWEDMPRKNRPQSEVQKLEAEIVITEQSGTLIIDVSLAGTDLVPVALELAFRKGGRLSGTRKLSQEEDSYLPVDDAFTYSVGDDSIKVEGFSSDHEWTQLRGAAPKINAESVYFTAYTPMQKRIIIS